MPFQLDQEARRRIVAPLLERPPVWLRVKILQPATRDAMRIKQVHARTDLTRSDVHTQTPSRHVLVPPHAASARIVVVNDHHAAQWQAL